MKAEDVTNMLRQVFPFVNYDQWGDDHWWRVTKTEQGQQENEASVVVSYSDDLASKDWCAIIYGLKARYADKIRLGRSRN